MDKSRAYIARKVRELRQERRWTQAELSKHLQLSQSRLSEIERGESSFTAEQLLAILKLFNVPVSYFSQTEPSHLSEIQNALARLGATHLVESANVLPSERLEQVIDVFREAIVSTENARLIAGLAPVLVLHVDHINLPRLDMQLAVAGLERRIRWLVDNTIEAVRRELYEVPTPLPPRWGRLYRRADVVLAAFLQIAGSEPRASLQVDIFDASVRSKQTLENVVASSSAISRKWGIVTSLMPEDFVEALRAARDI